MTEKEFWGFLNQRGKVQMLVGNIATGDIAIDAAGEFIRAHALLPKDYDNLSEEEIINMGGSFVSEGYRAKDKRGGSNSFSASGIRYGPSRFY